jgi:hypothetical protein
MTLPLDGPWRKPQPSRMKSARRLPATAGPAWPGSLRPLTACALAFACSLLAALGAESGAKPAWRPLALITGGKVEEAWRHVGCGGFVVDGDLVWFREVSVRPLPNPNTK